MLPEQVADVGQIGFPRRHPIDDLQGFFQVEVADVLFLAQRIQDQHVHAFEARPGLWSQRIGIRDVGDGSDSEPEHGKFVVHHRQGHDVHPAYRRKGFKKITEDSTSIWLTMDELKQMEALDLSDHPLGLALTRDLFLIGCFTGLRVSDLNRLQSAELVTLEGAQCISFKQQKTDRPVLIPVHPVVQSILDRHNGPPRPQNDQIINRNLKRLGQLMELTDSVQIERTVGGAKTKESKTKWAMLTSHCARRSFCTNNYLMGTDALTIMAISGHKTEKSFRRYLKLGPEH